jgi:hypothetical protein
VSEPITSKGSCATWCAVCGTILRFTFEELDADATKERMHREQRCITHLGQRDKYGIPPGGPYPWVEEVRPGAHARMMERWREQDEKRATQT